MELAKFCSGLSELNLTHKEYALAILWFHDKEVPDVTMTSGQISKIIFEAGLGNPNSTVLGESLKKSKKVIYSTKGFRLKALSRSEIKDWLQPLLKETLPFIDQEIGYLPQAVWKDTRDYIERVCIQLNGCFQFQFYDAAAVLARRLIETLVIECYDHLKREAEIKGSDGNYLMLKDLIIRATDAKGLTLGRDAKKALQEIKELGDRSAHNRRFNAVQADLDKIQAGVRVAVDEMIKLAALRRAKT